jgi:hypothetical protein
MVAVSSSPAQTPRGDLGTALCWLVTGLLGAAVCVIPLWLWHVPLRAYVLKSDDFDYLVRSRTAAQFWRHLLTPHYLHVVPMFRLETHLLAGIAGSLEALPDTLARASYATLLLAVVLMGHVVAHETGRAAAGVAAMAAVSFSSVLGPSLLWYAASQALAAGVLILAMLAALQSWRVRGSWWRLALALAATIAAPLFWTAGYIAGAVGTAYLLADGRRSCRRAAALPLTVSLATFLLCWGIANRTDTEMSPIAHAIVSVESALVHTAQAVSETLLLKNFGLDATTTPSQGFAIASLLAAVWIWWHLRLGPRGPGGRPRVNPLEVAGLVLAVGSYGITHAARAGGSGFESVRVQGWYDAIPELGAILFVAGWWAGGLESPPPRSLEPPRRQELLAVTLIAGVILLLQAPRIERVIYRYHGLGALVSPEFMASMPVLTPADLDRRALAQRRSLAALDRLERSARTQGIGRAAVQQALARTPLDELSELANVPHAVDLLNIPDEGTPAGR